PPVPAVTWQVPEASGGSLACGHIMVTTGPSLMSGPKPRPPSPSPLPPAAMSGVPREMLFGPQPHRAAAQARTIQPRTITKVDAPPGAEPSRDRHGCCSALTPPHSTRLVADLATSPK